MSNVFVVNNGPSFSVANTIPTGLGSLQSRLQFQNQNHWQPAQQLNETISNVNVVLAQPASRDGANVSGVNNLADGGIPSNLTASGDRNWPVNSVQAIQNAPLAVKANL